MKILYNTYDPDISTDEDQDAVNPSDQMTKIKNLVISCLSVDVARTRINIGHKSVFEDYLEVAKKKVNLHCVSQIQNGRSRDTT